METCYQDLELGSQKDNMTHIGQCSQCCATGSLFRQLQVSKFSKEDSKTEGIKSSFFAFNLRKITVQHQVTF